MDKLNPTNPGEAQPTIPDSTDGEVMLPMNQVEAAAQQEIEKPEQTQETITPEKPENSPEKQEAEENPEESGEETAEETEQTDDDKAQPDISSLYGSARDEVLSTGELSPETREALIKGGVSEETINEVMGNFNAKKELMLFKAYQVTGGEEGFQEMAEWCQQNMSEVERKALMQMFENANEEQYLTGVEYLHNQYTQRSQMGGIGVKATSGSTSAPKLFRSLDEVANAMSDPDYSESPSKQRAVDEMIAASLAAGTISM